MSLLKEYKWWIVLLFFLFAAVFSFKYFRSKKESTESENIISNWEKRSDKIVNLLSFYKSAGAENKLSEDKIKLLQSKLKEAHCSSIIKVDQYFKIEYKNENIWGVSFHYNIFDRPIADSMIKASKWVPCIYLYFRPDIVLEMHGGAIGVECWTDYLRSLKPIDKN